MIKDKNKVLNVFSLSVIFIDSVYRTGKNYYPQVFLEECKYFLKEKKMPGYINVKIETSSDNSDEENFDEFKFSY